MIGGTLLLCSGLFCRAAGLNKYLKTQPAHKSYKEHKRYVIVLHILAMMVSTHDAMEPITFLS